MTLSIGHVTTITIKTAISAVAAIEVVSDGSVARRIGCPSSPWPMLDFNGLENTGKCAIEYECCNLLAGNLN